MEAPLLIAHRGYSSRFIENTMPAFQAAADFGADWIECDVHLSRDGEVIIHHDESLKRLSGRKGQIIDYTLGELQQVILKKGDLTARIPSLIQYLHWAQDKHLTTNIEIKRHKFKNDGIEAKVVYLIEKIGLVDQVVISSFDHQTLHQVRKANANIKLAYLTQKWDESFLTHLNDLKPTFIHARHNLATEKRMSEMHKKGYKINAWTVNESTDINRIFELGVNGIVTDYLEKLEKLKIGLVKIKPVC